MNIFSKVYCRVYQTIFKWLIPILPYREPTILDNILDIKNVLEEKQINNVLIVADEYLIRQGQLLTLEKDFEEHNIKFAIYDKTVPNPTIENIEEAYDIFQKNECKAIIAFGGGSIIDCAKIVGARVAKPKMPVRKMKGILKIRKELPLLIAVPTTAGTGSETTLTAVITDSEKMVKYTINDFNLIPKYAVLDENLTVSLPPNLTATTGMDALTHAIEAYIGNSTTKDTRHYSLEACRLILENITKVYTDGNNLRARKHMLKASYLAGLAFTKSYVGYVHAIAHTLGGKYHTPHGLANAVILPYILSEYGSKIYEKLRKIAVYCNIARPYDSDEVASNKLINKIFELNEFLNIPRRFDFINKQDIVNLAKLASAEANPLYPVPKLMSAKELEKIYYKISI